jgi:hypothetical protein
MNKSQAIGTSFAYLSFNQEKKMSLEQGFNIVDGALTLALKDLEQRGMPSDEAQIALLIRLNAIVPLDVLKVAKMLCEDPEVFSAINDDKALNAG